MKKAILLALIPLASVLAQDSSPIVSDFQPTTGAVYVMANTTPFNQLVTYDRSAAGSLTLAGLVPTGGAGTGTALGSDNAVQISKDQHWLLTVNAGSNSISLFRMTAGRPALVSVTSSFGTMPVSLAIFGNLVYVLNEGSPASVTGFSLNNGQLVHIPGSTRPLSTASPQSPQIGFDDDGGLLLATEKATNLIDTFVVQPDGTVSGLNPQPSVGQTPFGFLFDGRGHLLVTDAFGGAAGQSAASSYNVSSDGSLHLITGPVNNGQAAACWLAVTKDNHYVYVANTSSNNISAYSLDHDGSLRVIGDGAAASAGAGPADMDISRDNRFLYVLNGGAGTVQGYRINSDGSLTDAGTIGTLPLSTTGLAAR